MKQCNFLNKIFFLIYLLSSLPIQAFSTEKAKHQSAEYKSAISKIKEALIYSAKYEQDSSLMCLMKSLEIAKLNNLTDLIPIIYVELSKISKKDDDVKNQMKYLILAEEYFLKDTLNPYIDEFYTAMAKKHFQAGELNKTLEYLQKTERARNRVAPFRNWKTYAFYANIYRNMKDKNKENFYLEKGETLARLQNVTRILSDIEGGYLMGEKDEKINELILQNKIIQMEVNGSKKQKRYFVAGLSLSAIILSLLAILLYQRIKNNKTLKEKNLVISRNLEEKEMLIKEIHHRVKNNLQLISSLLSLQSRTITDNVAASALEEGQNRVLAMALIHQNLYKDNISSGMEVKEYVTQLTEKLLNTYQIHHDKIKLVLDIDNIALDVSTLVPLGLIINELITNAIKYAFKEGKFGELKVSFKQLDTHLLLSVIDNGEGINEDITKKGFGMRLIEILSKKLEADLKIFNNSGTTVQLEIKNYKQAI